MKRKASPETMENWRRHAIKRARERCGVDLDDAAYEALNMQIFTASAQHVASPSNERRHWRVTHDGKIMDALYDKRKHMIITFMEPGSTAHATRPRPRHS